jgi:hypothetical protein
LQRFFRHSQKTLTWPIGPGFQDQNKKEENESIYKNETENKKNNTSVRQRSL